LVPGQRGIAVEPARTLERDGWNAATWHLYSHGGTHMDAPVHFGASSATIDQQPLARCMGRAWIARIHDCAPRAWLDVAQLGPIADRVTPGDNLLLHTGWSRHAADPVRYRDHLPRVSDSLARWCVDRRVNIL